MSANAAPMDDRTFYSYAHPKQRRRFCLALVFATLLFPLMALGLVAGTLFLIVPLLALLLWLGMRVYFAYQIGNAVLVSELNYPRIHAVTEEMKQRLGYDKRVFVFVHESKQFNTFLIQRFFRRAIFLNSEIIENGVSDDEVRWIVGRFVGYLRTRRQAGALGLLVHAAQRLLIFNFFILPYERAMVSTGDRLALAAIGGDVSSAISALQKLFVGREQGYSLNPEGIVAQHRQIQGTFFGFLARAASGFPHMTMRYVDLIAFAKVSFPGQYARFLAANPGMPEDLVQLASLTPSGSGSSSPVSIGNGAGWATCGITFAVLVVLALAVAGAQRSGQMGLLAQDYGPAPAEYPQDESVDTAPWTSESMRANEQRSASLPDSFEAPPAQSIVSREQEALTAGYLVEQGWMEASVMSGSTAHIDIDAGFGAQYLVLVRTAEGCDVDAIVNDSVKDDGPSPDASLQFGVSEAGLIRVELPVTSSGHSCIVGAGVYRWPGTPSFASD